MKQLTSSQLRQFFGPDGAGGEALSVYGFGSTDGGCLIVTKALIMAHGRGELVHIAQILPSGNEIPHHYGALIDSEILDGTGRYRTEQAWLKVFRWDITDKAVRPGLPHVVVARDDPRMVKEIAKELRRIM